jgi:type III secretion protein J
MMNRKLLLVALLALTLNMVSCQKVSLYEDLSEADANEMLVLLNEHGIEAQKKKEIRQNEIYWSLEVGEKDMNRARSLLIKNNLPRKRELGLTGVYKEKGLIPTPDEQKARYLLALKGEIVNSLERIPNIVDADVVLNVPAKDEFATAEEKMAKRPTASAIIKIKSPEAGESPITEAKIQQFVANAVEGMNPRDVTVIITYLTPEKGKAIRPGEVTSLVPKVTEGAKMEEGAPLDKELVGLRLDEESKKRLKIYLLAFFLLLMILSTGLIISIVQASRMRRKIYQIQREHAQYPAVEGQVMEEAPPQLEEGEPPESF